MDAIAEYRAASEANDLDRLVSTLAPDAELDPDGRIRRLRPHLRPWLASTWFALAVGAKVARQPGFLWRALRRF